MKIAVIVSTFPKLSETFILNQITGLCDRGHEVFIFSRFRPTEPISHLDVRKYDLLKKTRYFTRIPDSKRLCRIKAVGWILKSFFCRPGVVIRTLRYLLGGGSPFSYPVFFTALAVLQTRPDVIHCHYGHNGNLIRHLKLIDSSVAFITMFHGHDVRLGLEGGKDYYSPLFTTADWILANSEHTSRALLEQGANPQRIRVHPVGIELKKYPFRKTVSRSAEGPLRVLTVSRLHEDKGIEYSIRAIGHLISSYPLLSVEYRIVGDGPLEESLKQLTRDLDLSGQVHFIGALDQTGVIEQLLEADVFLLTSLHEGLGMALLEAQAVGLPIVATETDGIPEAVDPNRSAVLVTPKDIEGTAQQLYNLLMEPERRQRMGQAGRRHVERNFDVNQLNDTLVQIYEQIQEKPAK